MKARALTSLLLLLASASASPQFYDIQQSHIEANVPPAPEFNALLQRDLLSYFRSTSAPTATTVEYQLLRDGPTQTGIAYPKYYLWVRVLAGATPLQAGAVRVAAIDRTRFEVTSFLSSAQVKAAPSQVGSVFPAALVSSVLSRAGVK